MKTTSVLLALAAAPAALAHTTFTDFYNNGVQQGDAIGMRMRKDPAKATYPLEDLSSNDLACGVDGEVGVARVQSVKDGATLSFEFRAEPDKSNGEHYDPGHKGPCAVYLKKVESAINDPGHGDGWFKLFDHGYDADKQEWCSETLIKNNGLLSVVLPKGLQGGYYLARPELLALHNANKGDPQFYSGCAQIFLESSGNLVPESTVAIPGYVKKTDESVTFDIYNSDSKDYKLPGPNVAKLTTSSVATGSDDSKIGQGEGTRPDGCICENGNWCGFEVPDYSTEKECWASGQNCWDQADKCWNSAPATGNSGCEIWQDKCQSINDACNAGDWTGPHNKGKDLTPSKKTIDVGLILPTNGGGVATPKTGSVEEVEVKKPATTAEASKSSSAKEVDIKTSIKTTPTPVSSKAEPTEYPVASPSIKTPKAKQQAPKATPSPTSSASYVAPSKATCPDGYACVTKYHTVTKTEVVYSTVVQYAKRGSYAPRRR